MAQTEAQKRAVETYRRRNKEKTKIDSYRRAAKMFIRNHATEEDLNEIQAIIKERKEDKIK